jgi:hypothetical protein
MSPIWIALAALLSAEAGAGVDNRATNATVLVAESPKQWHDAVHAALRCEARTKGNEREKAIVELTSLYRQIEHSSVLPAPQRAQLRALLRSRLARRSAELGRQLSRAGSRAADDPPGTSKPAGPPARHRDILAQQQAPRVVAPPAATNNSPARELIDLIQNTIARDSWEVNGGLGTMRYFELGHLLIVRQTAEVHGTLGDTLESLRRN